MYSHRIFLIDTCVSEQALRAFWNYVDMKLLFCLEEDIVTILTFSGKEIGKGVFCDEIGKETIRAINYIPEISFVPLEKAIGFYEEFMMEDPVGIGHPAHTPILTVCVPASRKKHVEHLQNYFLLD